MSQSKPKRILMLLENSGFPEDCRVASEAFALVEAGLFRACDLSQGQIQ